MVRTTCAVPPLPIGSAVIDSDGHSGSCPPPKGSGALIYPENTVRSLEANRGVKGQLAYRLEPA